MSEAGYSNERQSRQDVIDTPTQANATFDGASGLLFEQAMAQTRMAVCLADPNQPDYPIVFVNRAFLELTGYSEEDVLGHNCRFLQGPGTDRGEVERLRDAVINEDVVVVELLNYRKDGTAFWNALHIGPIYHKDGTLRYIFGSQWDVTDVHAARSEERNARLRGREVSHRMKNMFAVISSIVNMIGKAEPRGSGAEEGSARRLTDEINSRIKALGRAHESTLDVSFTAGPTDPTPMFEEIVRPYAGDRQEALELSGGRILLDSNVVSILALSLHELGTNALRYGAFAGEEGCVSIEWTLLDADGQEPVLQMTWTERGGPRVAGDPEMSGTGSQVVTRMLRAANGGIRRRWNESGLQAVIELPVPG